MPPRRSERGSVIVRLWCENHDPTLRGTVIDTKDGSTEGGYGIEAILQVVEKRLREAEGRA